MAKRKREKYLSDRIGKNNIKSYFENIGDIGFRNATENAIEDLYNQIEKLNDKIKDSK